MLFRSAEMSAAGGTVLYSSHVLEQVEQVCDVLVLLHQGRLLWQGRVADLRAKHAGARLADIFLSMTHSVGAQPMSWADLLGK